MKAKKFSKKLIINKVTIANLSKESLKDVRGGGDPTLSYLPYTICDSMRLRCVC
jgi:hypothetical protein